MQALQLPASELTPGIHFDKEKEIFQIEGRSVADDPEPVFKQAREWLEAY
ncbi:MAG: SiaC family regulatory phosphoprotein, partial [Cyclobacteriaceae bacterium]|nr:SiaC family regulatory phosphoprotein [Cyclobacteriaceae bacterium]